MEKQSATWWKAQLLSNGIYIDESVVDNYDESFIEKRSAYGIQDPIEYRHRRIPQELFILPEEVVCAININPNSKFILKYSSENTTYSVIFENKEVVVSFPKRPKFYSRYISGTKKLRTNQVITLYGGHSLGAFIVRNCWIEKNGVCHFCSLCNNHGNFNDFLNIIDTQSLVNSVRIALSEDYPITQIMINGGNLPDLDVNFMFYYKKVLAIRRLLHELDREDIELHLIVSPPMDLSLIDNLRNTNIKIAMNMETYSNELFSKFCPGKSQYIGHEHIFNALKKCVEILGTEHVFSIFVGGLEPLVSLESGLLFMHENGIVPVINVLHVDPNTLMEEKDRPSSNFILTAGNILQKIYSSYSDSFIPFYYKCGRNSLDSEAYLKLF